MTDEQIERAFEVFQEEYHRVLPRAADDLGEHYDGIRSALAAVLLDASLTTHESERPTRSLPAQENRLSDQEREVARELQVQARAYREGTHGSPAAVARWLRILADKLDGGA